MQHAAVISQAGLQELLARACNDGNLIAPVTRGKVSFDFDFVSDPSQIVFEYVRTVTPPKKAIWPTRDTVLAFKLDTQQANPVLADSPFVLFGVHACDLKGINQLDWAMGQRHGVADPHYLARRQAATIVGIESRPDEYCFCTSVGSCETREGADLFLTPLAAGWFVELLSGKGEAFLQGASGLRKAADADTAAKQAYLEAKRQAVTLKFNADMAELPELLEPRYETAIFAKTAERCYSCGTCTNVCPTCFCFDMDDEVDLLLQSGSRQRKYDSCQFLDFALVAGGHNFRKNRTDRVRHRWFRKFVHLLREHGTAFCTGCGRCSKSCTAGISLVNVLNSVINEAREAAAK